MEHKKRADVYTEDDSSSTFTLPGNGSGYTEVNKVSFFSELVQNLQSNAPDSILALSRKTLFLSLSGIQFCHSLCYRVVPLIRHCLHFGREL